MRRRYVLMVLIMVTTLVGISSYNRRAVSLADANKSEKLNHRHKSSSVNSPASLETGYINVEEDGKLVCREATPQEAIQLLRRDPDVRLRPISPIRPNQAGLTIILRGTQQLESFPQARAAFLRAASRWEAVILNPITVVIDVDFGPSRFGVPFGSSLILGGTGTPQVLKNYDEIRTRLIETAANPLEASLYGSLPAGGITTDLGTAGTMGVAVAQLQALGLSPAVADINSDFATPAIGFNSNFPFDFDPANGIDADKYDFDYVAVHEIGHALGFISNTGTKELIPDFPVALTLWDIFRFRPGATVADFSTDMRILSSGGDQVFFSGGSELEVSTGRINLTGGDGRQASHWKDDDIVNRFIGIMDPSVTRGKREVMSDSDLLAFDSFGYRIKGLVQQDDVPPVVSVTSPAAGQTVTAGTQLNITWASSDNGAVTRHNITLSTDGGVSFNTPIATGLAGNVRNFLWSVPNIEIPTARIRVTAFDSANNQGSNAGPGNFSIVSAGVADFTLTVTPASQTINAGSSTSFTINAQAINNFTLPISLSATVSPANSNVTSSLSSATLTPGGSANLTVNTTAGAPSQTFTVSLRGTAGQIAKTANATVNVVAPDFQLVFNPAQVSVARGASNRFTLNLTRTGGFSGNVTVTAPDTKAIKVKISQPSQSTTGASLSFGFKIEKKASAGSQQLTFTGRDDSGRVRTGIVTLAIQ